MTTYTHSPDPSKQYAILRKIRGHVTRPYQGISLPKSKYPGYEVEKTLGGDELLQKEDVEVAAHEAHLEELVNEAERELSQKHPIVYDSYNLCELAQKKLNKFSLPLLNNICSHFGIDIIQILKANG